MACKFIDVDPDVLHVSFSERNQTKKIVSFSIKNLIPSSICYKMKSTSTERLLASPSCGYIRGLDQVEIIATITTDFKNMRRDKFLIQAVEVKHEHNWNSISAAEAMKRVPKDAITTEIKVPVMIEKNFSDESKKFNSGITENQEECMTSTSNFAERDNKDYLKTSDLDTDSGNIAEMQELCNKPDEDMFLEDNIRSLEIKSTTDSTGNEIGSQMKFHNQQRPEKLENFESKLEKLPDTEEYDPLEKSKEYSHLLESTNAPEVKSTHIVSNYGDGQYNDVLGQRICEIENNLKNFLSVSEYKIEVETEQNEVENNKFEMFDNDCCDKASTRNDNNEVEVLAENRDTISFHDLVEKNDDDFKEVTMNEKLVDVGSQSSIGQKSYLCSAVSDNKLISNENNYHDTVISNIEILSSVKYVENQVNNMPRIFKENSVNIFDRLKYIEYNVLESLAEIKTLSKSVERNFRDFTTLASDTITHVNRVENYVQQLPNSFKERECSIADRLGVIQENIYENVMQIKLMSKSVDENSRNMGQSVQDLASKVRASDEQMHAITYKNRSEINDLADRVRKLEASSADANCWIRTKFNETNQIMHNVNDQMLESRNLLKSFNEKLIECQSQKNSGTNGTCDMINQVGTPNRQYKAKQCN